MYIFRKYRHVIVFFLLVVTTACKEKQSVNLDDPLFQAALDTAVADAVSTQAAEFEETLALVLATNTPAPSSTPRPETPTLEPTPTMISEASSDISVRVSVDTNCRSGPGSVYPYQTGLFVGEEANVIAVDPSSAWLYIEKPDAPDGYCWIWGFYAETSQDTDPLPVYTPGPTPDIRPDFLAEYGSLEVCNNQWVVEFKIENTGPVALKSVAVYVLNTENSEQTERLVMNSFQAKEKCEITRNQAKLDPGESGLTISQELTEDPTGSLSFATITVCTEDNLAVSCLTKEFYFTP